MSIPTLVGKPVVKGMRIPVELALKHLAQNPDLADFFAADPQLTIEDVKACLAYAGALVEGEHVFPAAGGVAYRRGRVRMRFLLHASADFRLPDHLTASATTRCVFGQRNVAATTVGLSEGIGHEGRVAVAGGDRISHIAM